MKICPKCNVQMNDDLAFCPNCGNPMGGPAPMPQQQQQWQQQPMPMQYVPEFDHTAEFDPKDISDNKVLAMLPYLMGPIGIIIALLASKESPYTNFHIRQALKLMIVAALLGLTYVVPFVFVTAITIIVPIAAFVCLCIIIVLDVIAFFQVCSGKAKEPAIIRSLNFLK